MPAQENKDVYEGEVTELTPEETENVVRGSMLPVCSSLMVTYFTHA